MEKWNEIFVGMIPQGIYQTQITSGEMNGLLVNLESSEWNIRINFGVVLGYRVLDEGIVQDGIYSSEEINRYKVDNFKNVIYEILDGHFFKELDKVSMGYLSVLNARHFVIITQNYNIEIITDYEPQIDISQV